jgi:hypothetical protein
MSGTRHPGELIDSPHVRTLAPRAKGDETFPHPRYAGSPFPKIAFASRQKH